MRNKYNRKIINHLTNKYSLSVDYIYKCLRGDYNNETSDLIKSEYNRLTKELKEWEQVHLNS